MDKNTISEKLKEQGKAEDFSKVELRSEAVQEILGRPPKWIIRWGITVILIIIAGVFIGSYFLKYPEVIASTIEVSTENLPAHLVARSSGKIDSLFVKESQSVEAGQVLALIENTAEYGDIIQAKSYVDQYKSIFSVYNDSLVFFSYPQNLALGEIQSYYYQFIKALKDYEHFIETDFYNKKINALEKQLFIQKQMEKGTARQCKITKDQLTAQRRLHSIDSSLFVKKAISLVEYEAAKNTLLQMEQSYESALSSVNNAMISIAQLEQNILELHQQADEQKQQLYLALSGAYDNLQTQLIHWEQLYVFYSPISGKVALTKYWQKNQNVTSGETLLSIVPEEETQMMGKVMLPAQGSGKVKVGQQVNIKFDGFPYMEFGMVKGKVKNISQIPITNEQGKMIVLEIELPNKLKTNYGKTLDFSQEMTGTAEIITDDLSVFDRFLNPIKSALKR